MQEEIVDETDEFIDVTNRYVLLALIALCIWYKNEPEKEKSVIRRFELSHWGRFWSKLV